MDILFCFLYSLTDKRTLSISIIKLLANIRTLCIFDKLKRQNERNVWFSKYRTKLYGYQVLKTAKYIGEGFWCNGYSSVNENTILKEHVHFNGMKITGKGNVSIGKYFHSGIENLIINQTHNYDNATCIPYDKTIQTDIEIGDFVWFGSRVTVLPNTKIGEGAIIQAGSVVHGTIPPFAIAGGNPAVVFKYRDKEAFLKLKEESKFM